METGPFLIKYRITGFSIFFFCGLPPSKTLRWKFFASLGLYTITGLDYWIQVFSLFKPNIRAQLTDSCEKILIFPVQGIHKISQNCAY